MKFVTGETGEAIRQARDYARKLGIPFERIDADQLLREQCPKLYVAPEKRPASAGLSLTAADGQSGAREPEVKAMLFADVAGFSGLPEHFNVMPSKCDAEIYITEAGEREADGPS